MREPSSPGCVKTACTPGTERAACAMSIPAARGDGAAICCVVVGRRLSPALSRSLTASLRAACPKLVGVVECVNASPGNTVLSGQLRTLWGSGTLLDTLCGSEFELSPRAFYQINPPQAERLYQLALDCALPKPGGTALDLYCGSRDDKPLPRKTRWRAS